MRSDRCQVKTDPDPGYPAFSSIFNDANRLRCNCSTRASLPGNLFSSQSIGTNWLIKEGVTPTTDANDILSALGFSAKTIASSDSEIQFENTEEKLIYKTLNHEPMPIDMIAKISKIDPRILSGKLSMMELKGIIRNMGGGFIRS